MEKFWWVVSQNHDNVIIPTKRNTTYEGLELSQKCHKIMTKSNDKYN